MDELDELFDDLKELQVVYNMWAEAYSKLNHGAINPWFVWSYVLFISYSDSTLSTVYRYTAKDLGWSLDIL